MLSRNKREGRYAGFCKYFGHVRGGKYNSEFRVCKKPRSMKAKFILGQRIEN